MNIKTEFLVLSGYLAQALRAEWGLGKWGIIVSQLLGSDPTTFPGRGIGCLYCNAESRTRNHYDWGRTTRRGDPCRGDSSPPKEAQSLLRHQRRKMLLSKILWYFKMNAAKRINARRNAPGVAVWQRDYFEHIVRDEHELTCFRGYIAENPARWAEDENNLDV